MTGRTPTDNANTVRERAEGIARQFHETYERLAPTFGYSTRDRSSVPWPDVPEDNRRLMVAVVEEVVVPVLASGGRTEAAAVDQGVADVQAALESLRDCGDRPGMHDEGESALAALRVLAERVAELEAALRRIAEGHLGDKPWEANYDDIRAEARAALATDKEQA